MQMKHATLGVSKVDLHYYAHTFQHEAFHYCSKLPRSKPCAEMHWYNIEDHCQVC